MENFELLEALRLLHGRQVTVRVAVGSVYVRVNGVLKISCQTLYEVSGSGGQTVDFNIEDVRNANAEKSYILLGPGLGKYLPDEASWPEFLEDEGIK